VLDQRNAIDDAMLDSLSATIDERRAPRFEAGSEAESDWLRLARLSTNRSTCAH
jgi:hypothetical protein